MLLEKNPGKTMHSVTVYMYQFYFALVNCLHVRVSLRIRLVRQNALYGSTVMMTCSLNPLPDDKILGWSKLKQIADDIFFKAFKMKNK